MNLAALQEHYRPALQDAGLKITKPRLAILAILKNSKLPLTAQEIHAKASKFNIDQATVYRNLETLSAIDLVRLVNFQHDHNHYELATDEHHHHAICEQCGKVVDISKCDIASLEKQVKATSGFTQINHHALEFFGLCKTCAKK
ncbi:MAG TPA: transcriptional repressor [Candidatus Doudnabacteria bacterium]|nr:transcriptional repressor [Candidatus Doudnabacteria bacterium]